MASLALPLFLMLLLLTTLFACSAGHSFPNDTSYMHSFPCQNVNRCNASLYNHNSDLSQGDIATYYKVQPSQITAISSENRSDYLVTVPCSCQNSNNLSGYFYETSYNVKQNDIFADISNNIYSGQAWPVEDILTPDEDLPIYIPCGCVESESQIAVTYTVQEHDTLSEIANLLSSTQSGIHDLNKQLLPGNSSFIKIGWVLFVPKEKNGTQNSPPVQHVQEPRKTKNSMKINTIIIVVSTVSLIAIVIFIIVFVKRKRARTNSIEAPKTTKSSKAKKLSSSNSLLYKQALEEMTGFESERPVTYSVQEIQQATNNFDEIRILGRGGYGNVYYGNLGKQEVAVKKMISNKSKEFYAELKVLCKIHHINVVELLGFASGEDHFYLVYEYVQNGSLSDHLHDPYLKGHEPLSWSARIQIALDAAKGIEYIHDHTKARYVHRDIKTSNILLDGKLRAKVADFGLAKLVERTNDEDFVATRLVGTPGYLPPESVKELRVTHKIDIFAFGVVLSELITGKRALFRTSKENTTMNSLITVIHEVFNSKDPEAALETVIDGYIPGCYPLESVYKMAQIANSCLNQNPIERPEMREIVILLSKIIMVSTNGEAEKNLRANIHEASLDGNNQVFSGFFNGR